MENGIKRLKAADYEAFVDFIDMVFSCDATPFDSAGWLPKLYQPDDAHMGWNYAVVENGRIRAAVGSYPGTLSMAGRPFKVKGIGAVSTHRGHTGKGLMKALMNKTMADMESEGVQLTYLLGLRQRYGHYGYEKCGVLYKAEISQRNSGAAGEDTPPCELVQVGRGDADHLRFIRQLYESQPWHFDRAAHDLYDHLVSWESTVYVALQKGRPVGYAITKDGQDIAELFVEGDKPQLLTSVIQALVRLRQGGIHLCIPAWKPAYLREVARYAEHIDICHESSWRVYDFAGVTQALFDVKSTWCQLAGGEAVIGIEGYGSLSIQVSGGAAVCQRTVEVPDFSLDARAAMRLLYGNLPPCAVYTGKHLGLFDGWFPLPLCGLKIDGV